MERNVRVYPLYAVLHHAYFWMPVFFLYFDSHLSISSVLALEACYYATVVVLEVPSGYMSDRLGRRQTLLASALALSAAYVLFAFGASFLVFLLGQLCLAAGIALNSGTDTSFHYDSLAKLDRTDEYEQREATVVTYQLVATGVAAVIGGLVAASELSYAYVGSATVAVLSIFVVLLFEEPGGDTESQSFGDQLRLCLEYARRPVLAWLFAFTVFAITINHVPYEFYQPYLELLAVDLGGAVAPPIAAGTHMALATLIGAFFASSGPRLAAAIGRKPTLLMAGLFQVALIWLASLYLTPVVAGLLLLRGLPSALIKAPLRAAVTPRIPEGQRATYLSLQSLAGRLGFGSLLATLSWVAGSETSWGGLAEILGVCTLFGAAAWGVLAVFAYSLEWDN
jgi:MFS family permease